MGFFKKLFGLEEEPKQEVLTPIEENVNKEKEIVQEQQVSEERQSLDKPCELCKKIIGQEHYTKQGGLFMHKSCFKEKKKQLKRAGKIF